jgi:NTE family protein
MTQNSKRGSPFEHVVLVLQGGGALGSYQAGAFQALDEAKVQIDWLCGVSIGAMNSAVIAGNPPEKRVERLREFWDAVTQPPGVVSSFPWSLSPNLGPDEQARLLNNKMSAFANMVYGVPNFYSPRPIAIPGSVVEKPDQVSFYDTSPVRATLERLVDFDRINSKAMRLSVSATNAQTGELVYFDNTERKITVRHILASGSLPPGFPPTEIDGEYYWDGGVVSNSPLQWLIDVRPQFSSLVFQVDLWDARGKMPLDVGEANLRAMEIHSASRVNVSLDRFRKMQQTRNVLAELLQLLPTERRDDPRLQPLIEEAGGKATTLVQLKYQAGKDETGSKIFEFSRTTMEKRWRAGYEDARVALKQPGILELPDPSEALRVFSAHQGWR